MPRDDLFISTLGAETRAAFVEDGVLRRLVISRPDDQPRAGDIILGRVVKVAAQMDAAFVDLGSNRDGFLGLSEVKPEGGKDARIGDFLSEGDAVLVQVRAEPVGAKGAKLTAWPALPGRYLVFLPGQPGVRLSRKIEDTAERSLLTEAMDELATEAATGADGWIVRSVAAGIGLDRITAEARRLQSLWSDVQTQRVAARAPERLSHGSDAVLAAVIEESGRTFTRAIADTPEKLAHIRHTLPDVAEQWEFHSGAKDLFDAYGVEEQIQALFSPRVPLPSGGVIEIAETAAVVAIDVDTASASGGGPEDSALRVNLEAAEAVARQIHLRDLAGHMIIDFVPMRRRDNRSRVVTVLRKALERDQRPVQVAGYTPFGLVELTRQRRERSLRRCLMTACPTCEGAGHIRSPETIAQEALRSVLVEARMGSGPVLKVTASPAVVAALRADPLAALSAVEKQLGTAVVLNEDAALPPEKFHVTPVRRGEGS